VAAEALVSAPSLLRSGLALACAGYLGLTATPARAQGVDEFGAYGGAERAGQNESAQDSAFELRFGRYVPEVDSGLGGAPFRDTFGGSTRFLFGIEGDWQLLRIAHFGSIGPGVGWGTTRFGAKARFTEGGGQSEAETTLWIMPMYLVGVARADVFMRDFQVPLVPYAKFGFGYGLWWSSDGDESATANGVAGRGASYGLTWALGAMFLLDVLDREDAATADAQLGINNSYVFAEWFRPQLDGFGSNSVLNIGSSSWLLGIAIEM
jgi:hypothetical protein